MRGLQGMMSSSTRIPAEQEELGERPVFMQGILRVLRLFGMRLDTRLPKNRKRFEVARLGAVAHADDVQEAIQQILPVCWRWSPPSGKTSQR